MNRRKWVGKTLTDVELATKLSEDIDATRKRVKGILCLLGGEIEKLNDPYCPHMLIRIWNMAEEVLGPKEMAQVKLEYENHRKSDKLFLFHEWTYDSISPTTKTTRSPRN